MHDKITLPIDKMSTTSFLLCLEDENTVRWLRTQKQNDHFVIIDSGSYGDPEYKGYSMKFDSLDEGIDWIKSKIDSGWKLTFVSESAPVGQETLAYIHSRVLRDLKQI